MIQTTLVRTPSGARAITELKSGDFVCNEFGKPVRVKQVISRGKESVVDILVSGRSWATCDRESRWLVKECCGPKQAIMDVKKVADFSTSNRIIVVIEGKPFGFGFSLTLGETNTKKEEIFDLEVESDTNLYLLENGLVAHS